MIGRRQHDEAQSFDDALLGGTAKDQHVAELVRFAESLCEAAVVEPSTAFRERLRAQLMTEAATVLVPMPGAARTAPAARADQPVSHPVRRRLATVTAGLVASAGVVGLVASSASAVPGEMLYPVKRTVESVELTLHRDDASRGAFQLSQASERLSEARRLSDQGRDDDLVAASLEEFTQSAESGSAELFTAYSSTGEQTTVQRVNDFAATSSADLAALSEGLSADLGDSFSNASAAVTDLAGQAMRLCGECTPADLRALAQPLATKPTSTTSSPGAPRAEATPSPAARPRSSDRPSSAAPSTAPPASSAPTPPPVVTTRPPSLRDVTDPLVGGLLGDEKQPGLVPGLLNGLLGSPSDAQ